MQQIVPQVRSEMIAEARSWTLDESTIPRSTGLRILRDYRAFLDGLKGIEVLKITARPRHSRSPTGSSCVTTKKIDTMSWLKALSTRWPSWWCPLRRKELQNAGHRRRG